MHLEPSKKVDDRVRVLVPMPPDYKYSFSGSALPFPTEEAAFSPGQLVIADEKNGRVELNNVRPPNWYYCNGAYGPPRACAQYYSHGRPVQEMLVVHGAPRVPGRSLTPIPKTYATTRDAPVTSQERLLLARAMPSAPTFTS